MSPRRDPIAREAIQTEADSIDRELARRQAEALERIADFFFQLQGGNSAERFDRIEALIAELRSSLMSRLDDLTAEIDAATNAVAAKIDALIAAGGLTPAQEAALVAVRDRLQVLGSDPATPVPPDPNFPA